MHILFYVLFFYVGVSLGYLLKSWIMHRADYSGIIRVSKLQGKLVYSLELGFDPIDLQEKKEVVFKVVNSEEGLRNGNIPYDETKI